MKTDEGPDHLPPFPGFREMAENRQALVAELVSARKKQGLSQTTVAARMGTSQSVVARLESAGRDVLFSSLQRYAAAVGQQLDWQLSGDDHHD